MEQPSPSTSSTGEHAGATAALRFPCPSCGAGLSYDPKVRGLRCPFCGAEKAIDDGGEVAESDLAGALDLAREARAAEAPAAGRRLVCHSCSASVDVSPTNKTVRCAYCGSSHVVEEARDRTRIRPTCLIPISIDAEEARDLFARWIRSRWFRPNALRSRSTVSDLHGVMVPYWTYDAAADSAWTAMAGYYYWVTVGSGKSRRTVRKVRWVPASGSRHDAYDDVLVCASRGLDEDLLRKIEPFDLRKLVPYRDEYLSGWAAESYAVDVQQGWARAQEVIRKDQRARCSRDVPGDTQCNLDVRTTIAGRSYKHLLLPVCVAAYRYREKTYRFLINGQTGELHGRAPLSWAKILLAVLAVLAIAATIVLVARS